MLLGSFLQYFGSLQNGAQPGKISQYVGIGAGITYDAAGRLFATYLGALGVFYPNELTGPPVAFMRYPNGLSTVAVDPNDNIYLLEQPASNTLPVTLVQYAFAAGSFTKTWSIQVNQRLQSLAVVQ